MTAIPTRFSRGSVPRRASKTVTYYWAVELVFQGVRAKAEPFGQCRAWAWTFPVGPWNTSGLIIIPDDLSDAQFEYVQNLIHSGYPIILTTAEKPGPLVAVDNVGGVRQAFDHLLQHGHRRIAFIAGKSGRGGDTAERLTTYRKALRDAGIKEDTRLIAFGEHRRENGRAAMQQIFVRRAVHRCAGEQ